MMNAVASRFAPKSHLTARRRADKARDDRRWNEAAAFYREFLSFEPENGEIWVQLGHASKEAGDYDEAETAYRRAASLQPRDPDPLLHLGYMLKRIGRPSDATTIFDTIEALAKSGDPSPKILALPVAAEAENGATSAPVPASEGRLLLELEDVLQYLEQHSTVTGITRVVLNLVHHALTGMDDSFSKQVVFVYHLFDKDDLFELPREIVGRIVAAALLHQTARTSLSGLVVEARRVSEPINPEAGDLYFVPGAFWMAGENPGFLPGLRRRGVRVGAYIYDLIPITHAQYCEANLTQVFTMAFAEATPSFDFLLTISRYVADQVTGFMRQHDLPELPAIPVPLAHEMGLTPTRSRKRPTGAPAGLEELEGRGFVLCVCTIEARKNHAYLLSIWQRLIDEGVDVPDLVFVGRVGWRVADLLGQIEATRHLDGRLHVLSGISDETLSSLYDACLFTAFPSFVEGWGLPAGESLAHGKLCVASSTTSVPEVGGDLNVYVDPFNVASGYEVIRRLVTEPEILARHEADIRARFVPRTWTEVGAQFFGEIARALAEPRPDDAGPAPVRVPRLQPGELLTMRRLHNLRRRPDYVQNPVRLILSEGWRPIEVTGTWIDGPSAKLRFQTPHEAGRDVTVLLRLSTSPWVSERNTLRVEVVGSARNPRCGTFHEPVLPSTWFWCRSKGTVGVDGVVTVRLAVSGSVVADAESIPVAVRVHAFGYHADDDVPARLDLLDGMFTVDA